MTKWPYVLVITDSPALQYDKGSKVVTCDYLNS